ncbi:hypothetical protein [Alishewanella jeotgali]|uniref:Uncharacterized protein n=1 Tax=Alishewanella jeotgali KCTC 22429 TaxID=1129374 RepID=H3ZIE2_9ALTE|nr:hypothetical protein [Alishewanella jeotgali]EHR39592.1 hypothetical protein AJE_15764 [Alishewanella jeotgali KCTC 22429]
MFTVETWKGKEQFKTILDAVVSASIFEIEKDNNGQFRMVDGSGAFDITLTRGQLLELAEDLKRFAGE